MWSLPGLWRRRASPPWPSTAGPAPSSTRAAREGEEIPPLPPLTERCDTAMEQFRINALHKGEKIACLEARKQYCWYLKGVPYAGYWKERICHVETMAELEEITRGIKRDLN